ncbi:Asp/Glu/hydantoin racemase [Niveomyces insectorum RCEF 264]|uniref:Asp/Glu/hydantoin racemase n=1 Tax=Niveomyces insectorum RCEF 264 TaxID=1081102 RepID=A0A167Y4P9_9HYPO|nr:Asp/Glu/hydantoin racemase [Niveomyces insectorum RCEF 264]
MPLEARSQDAVRILLLNPNSSHEMTHGMEEAIRGLDLPKSLEIDTYTAPQNSPASINDGGDLDASTEIVVADLAMRSDIESYDAILVACYSVHPLVARLGERFAGSIFVTGIFESSILTALALLPPYAPSDGSPKMWGIVTTGTFWEKHLSEGVRAFLGQAQGTTNVKFAGVYSTGLDAGDFHGGIPPTVVYQKLRNATQRLLATGNVGCIVMGCAGMAGLEKLIRDVVREQYGHEAGSRMCVVDGVKAGVSLLHQTIQNTRAFRE